MTNVLAVVWRVKDWRGKDKRSLTLRYRYPEQETKLREGPSRLTSQPRARPAGTIFVLDEALGIVTLKRSVSERRAAQRIVPDAWWAAKHRSASRCRMDRRPRHVRGRSCFPSYAAILSAKHRGFWAGQSGHQLSSLRPRGPRSFA